MIFGLKTIKIDRKIYYFEQISINCSGNDLCTKIQINPNIFWGKINLNIFSETESHQNS